MTKINVSQNEEPSIPPPEPMRAQKNPGRKFPAFLISAVAFLGICCLTAVLAGIGYTYFLNRGTDRPVVFINSPQHGQTFKVGQEVEVQSTARDAQKVTRAELWVDGMLEHVETSSLAGGISPFPMLVDWQPQTAGQHNLTVRAFNSQGERSQAFVIVEALQVIDSDGDQVADEQDLCPVEAGSVAASGCPDRDGDGIGDISDACPDEAGMPESSGCPLPGEGDADGDGLLDVADACLEEPGAPFADGCPDADGDGAGDTTDLCPDEPGLPESDGCPIPGDSDADGVPDGSDACPAEPGSPESGGCADDDGDGVVDAGDLCPDEPGVGDHGGCPDSDLDGFPDAEDLCPEIPGSDHGCPEGGGDGGAPAEDRDGDGLHDGIDLCPDEPGLVENAGCPPPPDEPDSGEDGFPDSAGDIFDFLPEEVADPFLPEAVVMEPVEFQALSFELTNDHDTLTCYAGLAGQAMERWGPYELEGQRTWDLAQASSLLGGSNSRRVLVAPGEPLVIQAECGSETIGGYEEGGSWGTYYNLGGFLARHTPQDWDGHVVTQSSVGGDAGESFEASYRICRGSCEQAEFPPPVLSLFHFGGDSQLIWIWDGDRENIDGFKVYVNGNPVENLGPVGSFHSVRHLEPACGQRNEYTLTAYRGTRESPSSNTAYWSGEACPRQFRVSFETIQSGGSWGGDDESHPRGETMGPIFGHFDVTAAGETSRINFDAASHFWVLYIPAAEGWDLYINSDLSIPWLFDWIHTESASCLGSGCPSYSASEVPYVTIELGENDDLTLGGLIKDYDVWTGNDTIFNANRTLHLDEIVPGEYTISNRNITLVIRIEDPLIYRQ